MIRLEHDGVILREWQVEEAQELALQANDYRIWVNMRDAFPRPYGLDDAHSFIAMARQKRPPTFFAVEKDGRIAGGIGYSMHTDVERVGAEIGYWLGCDYWSQGIGTAALRALTGYIFKTHTEIFRLYAVPFSGNKASARILEKAGFCHEGTMRQSAIKEGRVIDQWMYALLRGEWEALPE